MIVYQDKKSCSGCTACMNACPKNAITMNADEEGFAYPQIDDSLCVNCGICRKVCPLRKEISLRKEPLVFAAKHINPDVVANSSSGGVFTALSDYILKKNGIVYGAAFDDEFRVCHQKAANPEQRNKFRGSKYVQSDLKYIFKDIKTELIKGTCVLFTGTPCQNAGLRSYLEQEHTDCGNLYQCDFVCHGTPSPLIWREYVKFLENKFNSKMNSFSFRSKSKGWKDMQISALFSNSKKDDVCNKQYSFLNLYSSLYITRPSCFDCKFTNFSRPSDITIADFWNIANTKPHLDDDKGVSLVLANTVKGHDLFCMMKNQLIWEESNTKDCWQPHLEYPCAEPRARKKFWLEYNNKGASYVIEKYGKGTFSGNMKKKITPTLKKMGLYTIVGKTYKLIFKKYRKG